MAKKIKHVSNFNTNKMKKSGDKMKKIITFISFLLFLVFLLSFMVLQIVVINLYFQIIDISTLRDLIKLEVGV